METIMKMRASELDSKMLDRLREFIGDKENADITITIKEFDYDFMDDLDLDFGEDDPITFPEEELSASPSPLPPLHMERGRVRSELTIFPFKTAS